MAQRRRTVPGGRRVDPDTGQIDGYDHRDHNPRGQKPWHGRHTADKTQERKAQRNWWKELSENFRWGHPNRGSDERRNP